MGLWRSVLPRTALPAAAALVAGCATAPTEGGRLLLEDRPAVAVRILERDAAERPDDVTTRRNLAIALRETGDPETALRELQTARTLNPDDEKTLFLLGSVAVEAGDVQLAEEAFREYIRRAPANEAVVQAHFQEISRQLARQQIRAALAQEAQLPVADVPENSVAVPPFVNVAASEQYAPLSKGLAAVMISDLAQVRELRVLERARIQVLQEEMQLAAGAAVDPSTAPRLGKLLGARRFAQGSYVAANPEALQMDAFVVETADSTTRAAGPPLSDLIGRVLAMEKRLVQQVLQTLGIVPNAQEQARIDRPATVSFEAFLEFSRGLDLEDRGFPTDALEAYRRALAIDPAFLLARQRADILAVAPDDFDRLGSEVRRSSAAEPPPPDIPARLGRTGVELGMGSADLDEQGADPTITSPNKLARSERTTIVVTGNLPGGP